MNYRTAYIRRSRKGLRLKKRAAIAAVLGFGVCLAAVLHQGAPVPAPAAYPAASGTAGPAVQAAPLALALAQAAKPGPRRIYPYSIVPGGVHERGELARIILEDKVVAAHYAGIDIEKAHLVTVARPRAVYVSYRKGDQVFWTAKKVTLAAGEEVLTDGVNELRARCGNRISDVPMLPVEMHAPSEADMDASVEVAQEGEGEQLNVAYAPGGDGATHGSWQLLSYANGAGLLALNGGTPAAGRLPFGQPAWYGTDRYPGASLGAPVALGSGIVTDVPTNAPVAGAPAADTPVAASTPSSDTPGAGSPAAGSPAASSPSVPTPGAPTPGAPGENIAAVDTGAPQPSSGSGGDIGTGSGTPGYQPAPVSSDLPTKLADTAQPAPEPEVKNPVIPDTLLDPAPLPVTTVESAKSEVPEPATLWLAGAGAAALWLARRRRAARAGR